MKLKELIFNRRTTRKYKGEPMDLEELKDLLMHASMGPSKGNAHPVEFLIVEDPESKKFLSQLERFGTIYVKDAPQVILILGDKSVDKTWIEEATITASYLGLLIEAAGYKSSWINLRGETTKDGEDTEEVVREYFNIPDNYGVLTMIPLGQKNERTRKRKEFDISPKVHLEKF